MTAEREYVESAPPTPNPDEIDARRQQKQDLLLCTAFVGALTATDIGLGLLLKTFGQTFPSSVAGMALAFTALMWVKVYLPRFLHHNLLPWCRPGSQFLARWMPLFFFVLLVNLPLLPIPAGGQVWRLVLIVGLGFVQTLLTGAAVPMALRSMVPMWRHVDSESLPVEDPDRLARAQALKAAMARKRWRATAIIWGSAAVLCLLVSLAPKLGGAAPLTVAFQFCTTLAVYITCQYLLPAPLQKVLPSFILFTGITGLIITGHAALHGRTWRDGLNIYMRQELLPPQWPGAGDIIRALLGPSVINIPFRMLQDIDRIMHCKWKIIIGVLVNLFVTMLSTAALAGCLGLSAEYSLAVIPRSITTPIAVAIADLVGAQPGIAAAVCIVSGSLGVTLGKPLLNLLGIRNKVARGVAMGSASHGLGTATLLGDGETDAGAVAGITFALMGLVATLMLQAPPFQSLLVQLSLGDF